MVSQLLKTRPNCSQNIGIIFSIKGWVKSTCRTRDSCISRTTEGTTNSMFKLTILPPMNSKSLWICSNRVDCFFIEIIKLGIENSIFYTSIWDCLVRTTSSTSRGIAEWMGRGRGVVQTNEEIPSWKGRTQWTASITSGNGTTNITGNIRDQRSVDIAGSISSTSS